MAANSQDQLRDTIWPEIGKWHRQLPEDLLAVGFTAVEEIELIRISTAKVPSPLRHLASMTSMQSLPFERDFKPKTKRAPLAVLRTSEPCLQPSDQTSQVGALCSIKGVKLVDDEIPERLGFVIWIFHKLVCSLGRQDIPSNNRNGPSPQLSASLLSHGGRTAALPPGSLMNFSGSSVSAMTC